MALPYSKASTPVPQPYDGQFKAQVSPIVRKRRFSNGEARPQSASGKTLRIGSTLTKLETCLGALVDGLTKFNPSMQLCQDIIEADFELSDALQELLEHQEAAKVIRELQTVSGELDKQINTVLLGLSECRRELQSSDRLESPSSEDGAGKVSYQELLSYATKITKFTHAPPGYNRAVPNEHVSLPWPTEDDLRRGMLAITGMEASQQEAAMAGSDSAVSAATNGSDAGTGAAPVQPSILAENDLPMMARRRSSIVSYGERPVVDPAARPNAVLDLDLFDPDEDDE